MSAAVAHALPPSILALFAPRVPLEFKPAIEKRKLPPYTCISKFVGEFEDPKDTPPPVEAISIEANRAKKRELKAAAAKAKLEPLIEAYDPANDTKLKGTDPYKTIFVARMDYSTTASTLRKNFEQFGPIKSCVVVTDSNTGKSRGYGFIEFEHERDMKVAYKQGDAKKIDGRRVLVDVERGRTVRNWKPRRLGGGLGSTRAGGKGQAVKNAGRDLGSGGIGASHSSASASTYQSSSARPPPERSTSIGTTQSFSWSTKTTSEEPRGDRGGGDRYGGRSGGGSYGGGGGGYGGGSYGGGGGGDRYDDRRRDDRYDDRYDRRRDDRYDGGRDYDRRERRRDDDYDRPRDRERDRERERRDRDRDRRREFESDRERDRRGDGSLAVPPPPPPPPKRDLDEP